MFEEGDWVVLLRNNNHGGGLKGQIFKLRKPGWPLGPRDPQWIIEVSPGNLALVSEDILKPVAVDTSYNILYCEWSERNRVWNGPHCLRSDTLEGFRREIREFARDPNLFKIVAKKKITVPYQDPNGEVIEMDVIAPAVPVFAANAPVFPIEDEEPMDDFDSDFEDDDEEEEREGVAF